MRAIVLIALIGVSLGACGWFGLHKAPAAAAPAELVVTGAPAGALIFVDGTQVGQTVARNDQSQILDVAPGAHRVDIHVNGAIVYHEDTYVGPGDRRFVSVLSGLSR